MKAVANLFLRAKHWQLFLLLFVVPLVVEITAMGYMPRTIRSWRDLGTSGFFFMGLVAISMFCFLGWLWAMGSFLNPLEEPSVRLRLMYFRAALLYQPVYGFVFFAVFLNPGPPVQVVLPLHLFAIFCLLYCFYFVARSLVTVNKGKQVSFSDYAKTLFLLYFYPIGVWIIQPRINQLYIESGNTNR
jgi:hypothetical protein